MSIGRIATYEIASANTNELVHTFTEDSTVDITICNRNAARATFRIAFVDGALVDLADEDWIYYDDVLKGTSEGKNSKGATVREAVSAGESLIVRASATGISFRISGRGA